MDAWSLGLGHVLHGGDSITLEGEKANGASRVTACLREAVDSTRLGIQRSLARARVPSDIRRGRTYEVHSQDPSRVPAVGAARRTLP